MVTVSSQTRRRSGAALLLVLSAYVGWTVTRITLHDSLTSVADDSSNYLVMALHYSPWVTETEAVRSVWPLQYLPPLFPLLLAISGAAHSLLAAHVLVVLLGGLALVALQRFARSACNLSGAGAATVCVCVALTPGYQLGLQGILSESLYMLLSVLFLAELARREPRAPVVVVLLAGAMLTRSIGFALLVALLAHAAARAVRDRRLSSREPAVALLAFALCIVVAATCAPPGQGEYRRIWADLFTGDLTSQLSRAAGYVAAQVCALLENWCAFLLVYWREGHPTAPLMALLTGAVALAGAVHALLRNRVDGWYVFVYLALVLAWPYPGQMMRFLLPIVPVMAAQGAGLIVKLLPRGAPRLRGACVAIGVVSSLIVPPHAYLHGRLDLARELDQVPVQEWLRKPGQDEALRELGVQNAMLREFQRLREQPPLQAAIAYYEPSYVALLAGRRSTRLEYPLDAATTLPVGELALLTAIHPRQSRASIDAMSMPAGFAARLTRVRCTTDPVSSRLASCLYLAHE